MLNDFTGYFNMFNMNCGYNNFSTMFFPTFTSTPLPPINSPLFNFEQTSFNKNIDLFNFEATNSDYNKKINIMNSSLSIFPTKQNTFTKKIHLTGFGQLDSTINSDKTSNNTDTASPTRSKLINMATSYVGKVNSDKEGNKLFSGGRTQSWCADFVSCNLEKALGNKLPSNFKHFSSVTGLKNWGEQNNCYKQVPATGKANYIANNIKAGDIMIEKRGGKSHTGIVTKVHSDGSFVVVEGNCHNAVAIQKYKADSPTLSGFISMNEYLA